MSGYVAEEVIGKRMNEFTMVRGGEYAMTTGDRIMADEEYMSYTLRMAELLLKERRISNWYSYLVCKNGMAIPIDMNITYLFDNQGAITGTVGIIREVPSTEKRKKK